MSFQIQTMSRSTLLLIRCPLLWRNTCCFFFRRRCPSAVPDLSFDTAGLSDGEMMARLGQLPDEDISTFLGRTKGLVVLMATAMQVREEGRRKGACDAKSSRLKLVLKREYWATL